MSKADLNSEFSFSKASCLTKAKKLSLYYLLIDGEKSDEVMPFLRALVQSECRQSCPGFQNESLIPFSMTINVKLNKLPTAKHIKPARYFLALFRKENVVRRVCNICTWVMLFEIINEKYKY